MRLVFFSRPYLLLFGDFNALSFLKTLSWLTHSIVSIASFLRFFRQGCLCIQLDTVICDGPHQSMAKIKIKGWTVEEENYQIYNIDRIQFSVWFGVGPSNQECWFIGCECGTALWSICQAFSNSDWTVIEVIFLYLHYLFKVGDLMPTS